MDFYDGPRSEKLRVEIVVTGQTQPRETHWPKGAIFTLGHSTLPIDRFIGLLRIYGVQRLVDVRTVPRPRHNPQFNDNELARSLVSEHIEYMPMPALGGLRHARKDSPNTGWRNAGFRGYADYMQTPAFANAVEELIAMGRERCVAVMCAEAVPWRCHRSLVADALNVRGVAAVEILTETNWRMHKMTPFAQVEGTRITYPPEQPTMI